MTKYRGDVRGKLDKTSPMMKGTDGSHETDRVVDYCHGEAKNDIRYTDKQERVRE